MMITALWVQVNSLTSKVSYCLARDLGSEIHLCTKNY